MPIPRLAKRSVRTMSIFLLSLCALLGVSAQFVVPHLASVSVQNKSYQVHTVGEYYKQLQSEIDVLAERRLQLLEPVPDAEYRNMVVRKHSNVVLQFLENTKELETQFTLSGLPLIAMKSRSVQLTDVGALQVTLVGRIVNAEDRSFSVLSAFVSALEQDQSVRAVEHNGFSQVRTGSKKAEAPFTIRITLHND